MRIKFQTMIGKSNCMLDVEPSDSVLSVKQQIFEREGIRPEEQTLIFDGKQLDDSSHLIESGLQDASTLHVVIATRPSGTDAA